MENKTKDQLMTELREEIAQDIEEQVESQVEEEVEEEVREHVQAEQAIGHARTGFIAVAATIMALGQFSEAVTLIEDGIDWALSKITHNVQYDLLKEIHVGNTQSYIEDLLGNPQVSRTIDGEITANYYHHDKFLLTIFISESRVAAFTVIPLLEDFIPQVQGEDERTWELQKFTYAEYPANPQLYLVDHSKTTSYYMESLDTGRAGLFFKTYLGNVSLLDEDPGAELVVLYKIDVYGEDNEVARAQRNLRNTTRPNFYGLGTLSLEQVQMSILTGAEFSNYFGY